MSSDAESKLPPQRQPDIWTLPSISSVSIDRVRYEVPRNHTIAGRLVPFDEGVEILVETDGEIPVRALGPALHIGAAEIAESDQVDERTLRFFVLDESAVRSGEPIVLGWTGHRARDPKSDFRYEPPPGAPPARRRTARR